MIFELAILLLAVYNIWYGAICWNIAGINGLLIGSCWMVVASILGVVLSTFVQRSNEKVRRRKRSSYIKEPFYEMNEYI